MTFLLDFTVNGKIPIPPSKTEIADHILNSFQNLGQKISPVQSVPLHIIIPNLTDSFI